MKGVIPFGGKWSCVRLARNARWAHQRFSPERCPVFQEARAERALPALKVETWASSFCEMPRARQPLLYWLSQRSLQRHSAAYGLRIDGDLLELGFDIGRNVGLRPSAEVLHQEPLHRGDHGEVVDGPGKAVALV